VLIVSTLRGCPVACPICDAGGNFQGPLSAEEIWAQIEDLVRRRHPDLAVPIPKFKIQFARMGDPAFNDAVLEVLRFLPQRLRAPGLLPSISTIAPGGRDAFFEDLLALKQEFYSGGRFQMQFSLHSTCQEARRRLVPVRTWSFAQMAAYGARFFAPGDRKLTLNFAPAVGFPLAPSQLLQHFDPALFAVKLTPINPTAASSRAGLVGLLDPGAPARCEEIAQGFRAVGYQTILSIGELSENEIGSNCGMLARALSQEA
jgi:23S rRNA (adenine2503-C2)-methyltransferase